MFNLRTLINPRARATPSSMEPEEFVKEIYRLALGREADAGGLTLWAQVIRDGGDPTLVLRRILESEEYQRRNRTAAFDTELRDKISAQLRDRTLTIVDVGAQTLDSEDHIYAPICAAAPLHKIIGFEPLADKLADRVASESPQSLMMLPYAVGDNAEHTLYVNSDDATSSIFPLNQELCSTFEQLHGLRTVSTLSTTTRELDDLLPYTTVPIDFLKLDIQGAELMALKGAKQLLRRTAVVHCEVEFSPIYQGQPLFPEIQTLLNENGFDLIDIAVQTRYTYRVPSGTISNDRLLWADAIFFRRCDDRETLLSQALTALVVYKKPSLAEHLLVRAKDQFKRPVKV
jgi:FkbM family methyltransferase